MTRVATPPVASASAPAAGAAATASGKPSKPKDGYDFFEVLGKGGFGEVRRGKRKADGKM